MRARSFVLAIALVCVGGLGPVPATAAVDPDCLKDPLVGNTPQGVALIPQLTTKNEPMAISIIGALLEDCPNTTVTARTPGGGLITVPLNQNFPAAILPERLGGFLVLPLGYGAGMWQLTKITSGGTTKTLHHPFDVYRGVQVTLADPAPAAAPNPVSVSGSVKRYTSTGALAGIPNATVAIYNPNPLFSDLRYLKTTAAGSFSGTVALPPGDTFLRAVSSGSMTPTSTIATVTEPLPPPPVKIKLVFFNPDGYVNEWWRLAASTTPGTQFNDLQRLTPMGWRTTGSFGYSAGNGSIVRWWKPSAPGNYTLRLRVGGGAAAYYQPVDPIVVASKQTIPTYVDAKVRPTNGGTVYGGTPMTLDGHLKVRYSNGTIGPFANQQIRIQTRPAGTSTWTTGIATLKTSSTGYFLTHWAMRYQSNVDIRFLFLSPYVTIKNGAIVKSNIKVSP